MIMDKNVPDLERYDDFQAAVFVVDENERIVFVNRTFSALFGVEDRWKEYHLSFCRTFGCPVCVKGDTVSDGQPVCRLCELKNTVALCCSGAAVHRQGIVIERNDGKIAEYCMSASPYESSGSRYAVIFMSEIPDINRYPQIISPDHNYYGKAFLKAGSCDVG